MERFADLTEREVLALAINKEKADTRKEKEDTRAYFGIADGLREQFPNSAKRFGETAAEEVRHRGTVPDLYRAKFGDFAPLLRRSDVRGFIRHRPLWRVRPLGLGEVRKYAAAAECYVRYRYMDTPFLAAAFEVVIGGIPVFLAGILVGSS